MGVPWPHPRDAGFGQVKIDAGAGIKRGYRPRLENASLIQIRGVAKQKRTLAVRQGRGEYVYS